MLHSSRRCGGCRSRIVDSVVGAALASWRIDPAITAILICAAIVYWRGWLRGRRLLHDEKDQQRLAAFGGGLAALFLALESPLDAFDSLYLSAHMTQHLLLMMIAPPLLLLSHPMLPLLRGLPKRFVKEGLGPFLAWRALQRVMRFFVTPPVAWAAFAVSTIGWHLPFFYELALSSPAWHGAQHASFFWTGVLFWWPIVRPVGQPSPGKARWPKWIAIPYLLSADIVNTIVSAAFIFSGKLLYPSYAAVRAGGISPVDDQTLAGAIMWVPGSVIYLVPTVVFAMGLLSTRPARATTSVPVKRVRRARRGFQFSGRNLIRGRRVAQFAMLLLAIAVMADGFFGPQVAPLNLAGVLPWIHWRALSVAALLLVGNLFCMACPFTFVRDIGRRVLPARWRWPRVLRTKWLPAALLVIYLWAYEAYGLWDSPLATAWIIAGYFLGALIIDGFFRGASFCKYVCPIGQFHFVSSLVSPREVRVRSVEVCKSCRTHDCIRGNETARGCELYLFQPKKAGNLDCTFCLDCVKACPHDNVSLLPVLPASTLTVDPYRSSIGRLSKRTDFAALALLIVFGAFVNAAGMVGPVMMWEHGWHARLGAHMMPVIVGAFVLAGAVVFPALLVALCGGLNRLTSSGAHIGQTVRRFVFALVPLGFAMWVAHLLYHFAAGWSAPSAALERLLSGMGGAAPMVFVPGWLTSAQIVLLDAGLLLTLYVAWRVAKQQVDGVRRAMGLMAPWMAVSCGLYGAGIWILFQPMQMRGMMH